MKKKTANKSSFWIGVVLGLLVAAIDDPVGFPIAVAIALVIYFIVTKFNRTTFKTN